MLHAASARAPPPHHPTAASASLLEELRASSRTAAGRIEELLADNARLEAKMAADQRGGVTGRAEAEAALRRAEERLGEVEEEVARGRQTLGGEQAQRRRAEQVPEILGNPQLSTSAPKPVSRRTHLHPHPATTKH